MFHFSLLLGADIIGGFVPFPSTNVHDELHARCLVLDDGQTKLALVVRELLGIDYCVSQEARKLIEQEVGIPPPNVLLSAVHAHSAASALGVPIAARFVSGNGTSLFKEAANFQCLWPTCSLGRRPLA